ncbi:MAG: MMPL family transporter [Bauldia sp.]|nr:MMPL family transporter [Bauldia sp.]
MCFREAGDTHLSRMDSTPEHKRPSLGFGIERIGLIAADHPRITAVVLAIILGVAVYGLFNISIDRNLRDLFNGETEAYRNYQTVTENYADPENQILVLVEGAGIAEGANLQRLQFLHLDMQLLPEIGGVYSLLSLLRPPDEDGRLRPVVSDAAAGLTPELVEAIRSHPMGGSQLLSADLGEMVYVVTPAAALATQEEHAAIIDEIAALIPAVEAETGLNLTISGPATLRNEIVQLLRRDQLVLNGSGLIIGFFLSLFLFRSLTAAMMTAIPASAAGLTLIGWQAALGIDVTIMSNVVPAVVMILGYADGMHISYAFRRHRDAGLSPAQAERRALDDVGAACVLAALATGLAFLSMTISDVRMVRSFGWVGSFGTVIGVLMVLVTHGLVARLIGRYWSERSRMTAMPISWLAGPLGAITAFSAKRARLVAAISVPLTIGFVSLFLAVPPENSIGENIPSHSEAGRAYRVMDSELGGSFAVQVIVPMNGLSPTSAAGLERIRDVHRAVAAVPGSESTLSLWSIADWAGAGAGGGIDPDALAALPEEVQKRFVAEPGALVTVMLREMRTADTKRIVDAVEAAAWTAAPDAIVTGGVVLSAREATRTIRGLNLSLALDVILTIVLIGLAFRKPAIGIVALIPNLLPIAATGSILFFLGDGMQFTSVVSLTIAYGIAVDDTVHYLNTLMHETRPGRLWQRLVEGSRRVGPVLVGTTLVIVTGMMMTLTSGLPTVALFGMLAMASLTVALVGDLLFLPAIIAGPARRWFRTRADEPPAVAAEKAADPEPVG